MRRSVGTVLAIGSLAGVAAIKKKVEIDPMKHDIQQIYGKNFDSVIGSTLPLTVSSVLYFRGSNRAEKDAIEEWNKLAKDLKKMVKVAAMDCDDAEAHCKRTGVETTPHVHIYPQQPIPNYKWDGEVKADALKKRLMKSIPGDKVVQFKDAGAFDSWKKAKPQKIKIVLFSDKPKIPPIMKALSTDSVFVRTIEFGFVPTKERADIVDAVGKKAKTPPSVMLIAKGKTSWYKEKDLSYIALHDWINVNSESGMGDSVKAADGQEAEAEEPEYEKVRELHAKSQSELMQKKSVVAVYLQKGDALDDKVANMIQGFESKFAPKNDRGINYTWMWLNADVEKEFVAALEAEEKTRAEREDRDLEPLTYPTMIFVKPPKKKREEKLLSYLRMPSGTKPAADSVSDMVEKVSGGATYTRADFPKFVVRPKAGKPGKAKEEL